MRTILTGQVGIDKKRYLQAVAELAAERSLPIEMYHVGNRMYA